MGEAEGLLCFCLGGSDQRTGQLEWPEASITIITLQKRLSAHYHPQKTKRKMAILVSPYKAMNMVCQHTAWPPWARKQTNACSWVGCISLHTAVPGCLNSLNGAVITRYLLVTLLDLFHSLGWQTAWTGLVLLTASSFSPSQSPLLVVPHLPQTLYSSDHDDG